MTTTPVPPAYVVGQLRDLGVRSGGVLLVHTSFSRAGPVEGGPAGLIAALREAVGPGGTLVMPSMSSDDEHPFDAARTPCPDMGVTADTFWRGGGVLRSDNPHAFAAAGPLAAAITAPHPIDPPPGADSPVGRARDHDGQVLLLGAGHDANTTIHLAENEAGVRYRRAVHVTVLAGGRPVRFDYAEIDHCCARFALLDDWLEADGLQRRSPVPRRRPSRPGTRHRAGGDGPPAGERDGLPASAGRRRRMRRGVGQPRREVRAVSGRDARDRDARRIAASARSPADSPHKCRPA